MNFLGLLFEFVFLGMAIYFYLFAIGKINFPKPETQAKADKFRKENGRIIRLMALALAAIMTVNIFLHLQGIFA